MRFIKILQLLIIGLLIISCQKQNEYHIIGKLQDIPDSTIIDLFVQYENVGSRIASDTIINGVFSFSDTIGNDILQMSLMMRDRKQFYGSCDIWVGKSDIKVSGKGKYLSEWRASSNLKEQIAQNLLLDHNKALRIKRDSLFLILSSAQQSGLKVRNGIDSINEIILQKELTYIETNYNSLPAVIALYRLSQFTDSVKRRTIKEIINKMDTIYSNTLYGEGIKNSLKSTVPINVGNKYIDLYAYDLKGQFHHISDFNDKYILLDFWSIGCYPCILAAPEMREVTEKYKNELNVIGINLDTRKDLWKDATKRDSITWINLSDGKGVFGGAYHTYGINGFPTYILIDPQGIIVERWMGYGTGIFNDKLSKYLNAKVE
jgi:thiol-disulfide isomerase/thioredoxin